jgi:hypothetical protein
MSAKFSTQVINIVPYAQERAKFYLYIRRIVKDAKTVTMDRLVKILKTKTKNKSSQQGQVK